MERGGLDHGHVALVFLSGDARDAAHEILHVVRRITGARTVVGCSGAGVLTEQREIEGESAVAVLVIRDERLVTRPIAVERLGDGAELARAIADSAEATVAEGGSLVLLPDPRGLDPGALLRGLGETLGPVPVLGAVAAGPGEPVELCNTQTLAGGLAGVAVSGPVPLIGVAQGCAPIGEPYVITRAERNVVHQIAGRPALEVLREAMQHGRERRGAHSPGRHLRGAGHGPGQVAARARRFSRAEPHGRRSQERSRRRGRAGAGGTDHPVPASRRPGLPRGSPGHPRLPARAPERPPRRCSAATSTVPAGARDSTATPDHDVTMIREALGEFPVAGFFGNGELAPVGRQNFFHNYTGALLLIPE